MTSTDRHLRADAARNRAALLAAAEAEFADRGLEASVADIARRAGIGKGTVFRHFPTKEDLLAAVVLDRVDDLAALARRLTAAADPGAALLEFLDAAADRQQQLDLSFLRESGEVNARLSESRARLFAQITVLVERAQAAGAIRTDITATDVILLMCAPNHVASFVPAAPAGLWRRYLAIIFDGLRPHGVRPLPTPPPEPGQVG
ncbi:TetR/AcrR family transcriptional regulator [Micromonospora endophytica]|uniref:TetR family transcriptional regulator n=1 Tax=Micromonospora endophytica TaxID=515350 RepID=A0A2W2CRV3_9ACTN|nr:TetR/AcrR family transcriptional regulator [Micromonospora endophytica]PZG00651.1 TetR family transcriptional regulator [Micromonospora endophytica]RIW51477.1 TetR/AcrR family transcriptional regulator [Micromonospora endophytica]BCJ62205.1 TetR family transcriptional regulator [Micromonospora endophytica]